jgi:hypothetical protein
MGWKPPLVAAKSNVKGPLDTASNVGELSGVKLTLNSTSQLAFRLIGTRRLRVFTKAGYWNSNTLPV